MEQQELFPKTCEECGKKKKDLIKYEDKKVCFACWYKLRFPEEYAKKHKEPTHETADQSGR